jgi:hypothetical protein
MSNKKQERRNMFQNIIAGSSEKRKERRQVRSASKDTQGSRNTLETPTPTESVGSKKRARSPAFSEGIPEETSGISKSFEDL